MVYRLIGSLFMLIMFLLMGCAYHIRPQNVLPPRLYTLYLESPNTYGDFESTLRYSLQLLGVRVYNRPICGVIHFHLIDASITYGTPTIGGSNQARVYNLYYQAIFELRDDNNNIILPAQTVKTSTSLVINAGETLESTNQLSIQKYEMQREICRMIINILHAPRLFEITG